MLNDIVTELLTRKFTFMDIITDYDFKTKNDIIVFSGCVDKESYLIKY